MKNRYFLLGITGVLALAMAVPAFGGPSNPIASSAGSVKGLAKKALRNANAAQNTANTALTTANSASTAAKNAQTTADQAKVDALAAKTAAAAAQATADSKLGSPTTQNGDATASNSTSPKSLASACPAGSPKLLSGGYIFGGANIEDLTTTLNAPYGNTWLTTVEESDAIAGNWSASALIQCAS